MPSNLSRRARVKLAEYYPTIRDSRVIDLERTYPNGELSNYFYVKVKEAIPNIINGINELKAGATLKFWNQTKAECKGSKLICNDVIVDDDSTNLVLDFGTEEAAQQAIQDFKLDRNFDDFIPPFAAFLDAHAKIQPFIDKIRAISNNVFNG